MKKTNEKDCPFCELTDRIVINSNLWVAIEDAFPVNKGHMLIITRRHVASFRELTKEEFQELFDIMPLVVSRLDELHHPNGYNFGVNDGEVAGQTIFHVHFHVIPRYQDDDE
jgi:diadenosine tetraphosphate (Ap4A) HIT family hydrolase